MLRLAYGCICGSGSTDKRTAALVMNPGSPTFPRGGTGPTMGRIITNKGVILSAEIIKLQYA